MREIVYNIEEFKKKVDKTKPLHHSALLKALDSQGFLYLLIFRIYGITENGHVIIFEVQKNTTNAELERNRREYQKLVEKYAKPLGSTEGAWKQ